MSGARREPPLPRIGVVEIDSQWTVRDRKNEAHGGAEHVLLMPN